MPVLDGIAAARIIKQDHPIVQIVMLSAYDDPALKQKAEDVGVALYLIKGCRPAITRDAVKAASDMYRSLMQRAGGGGSNPSARPRS